MAMARWPDAGIGCPAGRFAATHKHTDGSSYASLWAVTKRAENRSNTVYRCQSDAGLIRGQALDCVMEVIHCLFLSLSSFRTFTAVTRVQIPSGTPNLYHDQLCLKALAASKSNPSGKTPTSFARACQCRGCARHRPARMSAA